MKCGSSWYDSTYKLYMSINVENSDMVVDGWTEQLL